MSIITMATTKGGAGKTTVAQMIIGAVHHRGYSVGVVDTDENQTLSNWLSSATNLAIDHRSVLEESKIVEVAKKMNRHHDLVVIDTPGAQSQGTVFAIGCADLVIIPLQLSKADVVQAERTHELVQSTASLTGREIQSRLLFTDYTPKTKVAKKVRNKVKALGLATFKTRFHHLVAFKELTFTGKVPHKGTAGAQGQLLVDEIANMGLMPFMEYFQEAS
ncbi:MAG: chromosome partitioning protein [Limisphaerales bacterium]|jgi:chromosome partitioning protein